MGSYLWIFDGLKLLRFDGTAIVTAESVSYTPTIVIAREPTGGGTPLEPINLISPKRIEKFGGTSGATVYQLTTTDIDAVAPIVKVLDSNGVWQETTAFTADYEDGTITFNAAPGVSPVTGEDNVSIEYSKTVTGYADRINKCSITALYGVSGALDRIFASGNPDRPNYDFYCDLENPSYWGICGIQF